MSHQKITNAFTIIGRGHSGTRAMSQTLGASGVFMGSEINESWDLLPPGDMYEACRVMAKYVVHKGGIEWDFSKLHSMPIDPAFTKLVESFLSSVLASKQQFRGWKLPETTLVFPWIIRLFPEIKYIYWIRDPRDCILGGHITDDLADFGVPYEKTDDLRKRRAISWYYQQALVKATPQPKHFYTVRFEDFVLRQDETLQKLAGFTGFPLCKIPVKPEACGRYKTDTGVNYYDFFRDDLVEHDYPLPEDVTTT
ncbi:MAG: sulfotransferase [Armatimonadetes bacterium]|nr:sulfotransferase [Armatimonadota bacterium]